MKTGKSKDSKMIRCPRWFVSRELRQKGRIVDANDDNGVLMQREDGELYAIPADEAIKLGLVDEVTAVPDGVHVATVSAETGLTRNLGNFESVRFSVGVTIPCPPTPDAIRSTTEIAQQFATAYVSKRAEDFLASSRSRG